jgi:hypothetical protein
MSRARVRIWKTDTSASSEMHAGDAHVEIDEFELK